MRNNLNSTQSRQKYKDSKNQTQASYAKSKPINNTKQNFQQQNKNIRPVSATKKEQIIIKKESIKQNKNFNPPQIPLPPKGKIRQQDLMTQSKIMEAKNGLQLLKKKESARGISRNKIQQIPQQKKQQENTPKLLKKVTTKKQAPKVQVNQKIVKQYVNPREQIPIKTKNVDFQKLIQAQLKKQSSYTPVIEQKIQPSKKKIPVDQYQQQQNLVQCNQGCGRKFKQDVIQKHQKICKKVFQNKRKAFDSAAQRKAQEQNGIPAYQKKQIKPQKTIVNVNTTKKQGQIPKWKLQSAAFRASIKQAAGKPLTKQQEAVSKQQKQLLVLCNSCGRRFNKNAAQRHIPFCESKAKMMTTKSLNATNNNLKKKK